MSDSGQAGFHIVLPTKAESSSRELAIQSRLCGWLLREDKGMGEIMLK